MLTVEIKKEILEKAHHCLDVIETNINIISQDKPSAKVICHSQAPDGEELITLEIELHRFILPEFNTHRVFSRNFQSSRAVPVEKMIEQVKTNPAIPVHWGKNQRGMVADSEHNEGVYLRNLEVRVSPRGAWLVAAQDAATIAEGFHKAGYHKQIVNRLLEPFMWTKGVVTATRKGLNSFFKLRLHKDAQPEIRLLAERMKDAVDSSKPNVLDFGDYHLPYTMLGKVGSIENAVKISTSCCAQVSYRTLDDSLEKSIKIYDMLNLPVEGVYGDDPPHYSPTEHVAKVVYSTTSDKQSGNFNSNSFWQYRKALEAGNEQVFLKQ